MGLLILQLVFGVIAALSFVGIIANATTSDWLGASAAGVVFAMSYVANLSVKGYRQDMTPTPGKEHGDE